MANKKISELPVASTLKDIDEFPIIQDATTKRASLTQLKTALGTTGTTGGGTTGGGTTGGGTNTLAVTVAGFNPVTAECNSTLTWDCATKQFVATAQPKFTAPAPKTSIKFLGTCVAGQSAVMAVTNENRIVYWGNDNNIIGSRNTNIAPSNFTSMKLLNNNGINATFEDYLSLDEKLGVSVVDLQYGGYGAMALLSDNTVWLNGEGISIAKNLQVSVPNTLIRSAANFYTRGYFLKVAAPNSAQYSKISYGVSGKKTTAPKLNGMIMTTDGNVYMFGNNMNGMCGVGVTANTLVEIDGNSSKVTNSQIMGQASDIFSGNPETGISYILTKNGTLYGAGYNTQGQLGDNTKVSKNVFTKISDNVKTFAKSPFTTALNTFFIKNDGTIWGCGSNVNQQLASGSAASKTTPVQITNLSLGKFIKIDVTGNTSYISVIAMTEDGKVYTWGSNTHGQCGTGNTTAVNASSPNLVKKTNGTGFGDVLYAQDIIASHNFGTGSCFYIIGKDNMIYAAGFKAWNTSNNASGANGNSSTDFNRFIPFSINIKRDIIKTWNVIDGEFHQGMFLTTGDGYLLYKGDSKALQGSNVLDDLVSFSRVM